MSTTKRTMIARVMVLLLAFSVVFLFNVGMLNGDAFGETATFALEDRVGGNRQGNATGGGGNNATGGGFLDSVKNQDVPGSDQEVIDFFKNNPNGLSGDQLAKASANMSPVTNLLGLIAGYIVILTMTGVIVITCLDLLYIAIPPIRNILYKSGTNGTGATMGMGGAQMAGNGSKKPTQWVSDEAVQCAALLGGSSAATSAGMGGMGSFGGMGGMNAQQENSGMTTKSVIFTYFKKRLFFLMLLAICIIVLSSSMIMGTGVNLAHWVLKFIALFNSKFNAG